MKCWCCKGADKHVSHDTRTCTCISTASLLLRKVISITRYLILNLTFSQVLLDHLGPVCQLLGTVHREALSDCAGDDGEGVLFTVQSHVGLQTTILFYGNVSEFIVGDGRRFFVEDELQSTRVGDFKDHIALFPLCVCAWVVHVHVCMLCCVCVCVCVCVCITCIHVLIISSCMGVH